MRPVATRPARRSLAVGLVAGLAAGLLLLVGVSLAIGIANAGKVMPGVRVAGVDVRLPTPAAWRRARRAAAIASTGSATLVADEIEAVVAYDELGRRYELDVMVEAALVVAREGNPVRRWSRLAAGARASPSVPAIVHGYDEAALARVAGTLAERVEIAAVDATVVRDGAQFDVRAAQQGRSLEASAVRAALAAPLTTADPADIRLRLSPCVVAPEVSNRDASSSGLRATRCSEPREPRGEEPVALALTPETIAAWLTFGETEDGAYGVTIDAAGVDARCWHSSSSLTRKPSTRAFSVAGGGLGGVIPGKDGRQLQVDESSDALLAALESRAAGRAQATLLLDVTHRGAGAQHRRRRGGPSADADGLELDDELRPRVAERVRRQHQHPRLGHRRHGPWRPATGSASGAARADQHGAGLHLRRRHHQRPQRRACARRRHLHHVHDAVQRGDAPRPRDR